MQHFFDQIEWSPGIGDPTFVGWLTVCAYFVCAYQSGRIYCMSNRIFDRSVRRQQYLWLAISCLMVFLGINKQLDLQTLFTATARYLSLQQGWYGERREMQKIFIMITAFTSIGIMAALVAFYARVLRHQILAIVGLCALVMFVLIRASSFHYMDIFIRFKVVGLHMNWVLELGSISLILINARWLYQKRRPLIDLNERQKNHRSRPADS